jgi:hypothetical protein
MNDALAAQRSGLDPVLFGAIAGVRADLDAPDLAPSLPGDHPAWQRDVLSISARVRALIAAMRPVVVKVLTFWDHRLRGISLTAGTLGIDASGCYRLR